LIQIEKHRNQTAHDRSHLVLLAVSRKQLRKRKDVSVTFGGKIVERVKICPVLAAPQASMFGKASVPVWNSEFISTDRNLFTPTVFGDKKWLIEPRSRHVGVEREVNGTDCLRLTLYRSPRYDALIKSGKQERQIRGDIEKAWYSEQRAVPAKR
jgi:hypothetical protein